MSNVVLLDGSAYVFDAARWICKIGHSSYWVDYAARCPIICFLREPNMGLPFVLLAEE